MANRIRLVEPESDPEITKAFQKEIDEKTAALAIIAPYQPAKVSPTKALWAEIGLTEKSSRGRCAVSLESYGG